MMDMQTLIKDGTLPLVKTTPGAYLGSCRYKLPEDLADPVYPELFTRFEEHEIEAVFYIGGNDSMDTVSKLSRYAAQHETHRFIGIPKTIDNDQVMQITPLALEAPPSMWPPRSVKFPWTPLCTSSRLSLSWN